MWVRTIKVTFTNELMKKSVESFMSKTVDLTEGMLMSYRVDISENVVLVNHFFPTREAADQFRDKVRPIREQLTTMGAKIDTNEGNVWDFKVAGDVTLTMLTQGMQAGGLERNEL